MNKHLGRIVDHVWGPGGSIALHVVVLLLLLKWLFMPPVDKDKGPEPIADVELPNNSPEIEKLNQEIERFDELPSPIAAIPPPEIKFTEFPQVGPVSPISEPTGREGPAVERERGTTPEVAAFPGLDIVGPNSPIKLKDLYQGRSPEGRAKVFAESGLNATAIQATEYAVTKSLDWLKAHQYPDGSWGPNYRVAMTGLAILTFLAHDETMASPDYGDTVRKGLRFLLRNQRDGLFAYGGWDYPGQVKVYEHAIGTYAISEAYSMTSIPILKEAMERAVQVIIDGQNEAGSWCYNYQKGPDAPLDVSVSGWQLQALKAAAVAGAENNGLHATMERGMRGLKAMMEREGTGLFLYSTRGEEAKRMPNLCMTGIAVLCMQLTGHCMDAEARAGIKALQEMGFHWTKGSTPTDQQDLRGAGGWPLYAWYYITQARFQHGGQTWKRWDKQSALILAGMQNHDGSWCPAPQSAEAVYGPVYCTTLSALMLQVYYRFLPTYQEVAPIPTKGPEEGNENILIRFG